LKGLVSANWEEGKGKRRLRVYRLTPAGQQRLHEDISRWEDFVRAVSRVLAPKLMEE
jgi:DNA-binding PadR family transcriptional regulator